MIVVAGKNDIAVWGLSQLLGFVGKDNLAVVLNRTDNQKNGWQKSLGYFARAWEVKLLTLEEAQECAEVFISLEFDRLVNPNLFKTKRLYNIHFSLLPKYKGMYTSIWPLLNGDSESGVTLHVIDDGIDTGPVIDQMAFSINEMTNSRDLYLLYTECAIALLRRNFGKLLGGICESEQQSSLESSYFSKNSVDFSKRDIPLSCTANEIVRFVRAFCFREYQLPRFIDSDVVGAEILTEFEAENELPLVFPDFAIVKSIDYPVKLYFDRLEILLDRCRANDVDAVRALMRNVVSVDDKNHMGWSPLMVAAYSNSYDVTKYLIGFGADVNATNVNGTTVLMYAKDGLLKTRDVTTFCLLIQMGSNIHAIDYQGKNLFDYCSNDEADFIRNSISELACYKGASL